MMNALIDLKQIQCLENEAQHYFTYLQTTSYWWVNPEYDSATFHGMMAAYFQATNLSTQLRAFHLGLVDFSVGNFDPYFDWNRLAKEEMGDGFGGEFEPFSNLSHYFDTRLVTAFPPVIEQYAALIQMVSDFPRVEETKRQHRAKSAEMGLQVSSSPEEDLAITTSLKGYNEFYTKTLALIDHYRPLGDIEVCAKRILELFNPFPITDNRPDVKEVWKYVFNAKRLLME
jgi:hypothetical protein